LSGSQGELKVVLAIESVHPLMAIPGGEVAVRCRGFIYGNTAKSSVLAGGQETNIVSCSDTRIIARILESGTGKGLALRMDDQQSPTYPFRIAQRIAGDLHPVGNPVLDSQGRILVTFSGSRGQKVPFSVYRVQPGQENEPYLADIVNPSGMAYDQEGLLYISSRFDGAVYRVDENRSVTRLADNLGIATGMAFDRQGFLYVGDRSGSIFKIDKDGSVSVFATLEPSVAAYHLAFGPDGNLYVTGPTLSSQDCVYAVNPAGEVRIYCCGFGRPQGLAFDQKGNLYLGASYQGNKGVMRIDPQGRIEQYIAGPVVVGLVFDPQGNLYLVDTSTVYSLRVEERGFGCN
jgi:sugar lactone lactonase YvrE